MDDENTNRSPGLLNYKLHVSQSYEKYYLDPTQSDVTLVIGDRKIPAHRLIICAESEYFKRKFADKNFNEIVMSGVSYEPFLLILQYMYSKEIDLQEQDLDVVLNAFELARSYGLEQLEKGFVDYLISILSVENVLKIFLMGHFNASLFDTVCTFIDNNMKNVLAQEDFLKLKSADACTILSRKRRFSNEEFVFRRIQKWIETNPKNLDILKCIDFSRLTMSQITQTVKSSKLFDDSFLFQILRSKGFEIKSVKNCQNPENFQTTGDHRSTTSSMMIHGRLTRALIVKLNAENLINHIQMQISFTIGYKIKVSTDGENWKEVIDYSNYCCDRFQDLYFPEIEVKCILLIGNLSCNSFRVHQSQLPIIMERGLICPTSNEHINAEVLNGNNESNQFKILWREFKENGLKTPYVTNPFINFNQPYWVNRVKFRLWDYDGRRQAYKISIAGKDEEGEDSVQEESSEEADGWKLIRVFPSVAIMSINFERMREDEELRIAFVEVYYEIPGSSRNAIDAIEEAKSASSFL